MKLANRDLRIYARSKAVPLYAVAKELGISDATLYVRLRDENKDFSDRFKRAVDKIAKEG